MSQTKRQAYVPDTSRSTLTVRIAPTMNHGLSLLEKRIERDNRGLEMSKREEDGAVGTWLFGRGGLRGFRSVATSLCELGPVSTNGPHPRGACVLIALGNVLRSQGPARP